MQGPQQIINVIIITIIRNNTAEGIKSTKEVNEKGHWEGS